MINFNFRTQKLHHIHQYKENEELKRHTKTNQYVYTVGINQSNTLNITNYQSSNTEMDQSEESQDENSVLPFLINSLTDDRGQIQYKHQNNIKTHREQIHYLLMMYSQ